MDNSTKTRAIELAAEHEKYITTILANTGKDRAWLTKQMMIDPRGVPFNLLKEVYYLDAYTRLINFENAEKDVAEWTAKDYVHNMVDAMAYWLDNSANGLKDFYLEKNLHLEVEEVDKDKFCTILLFSLAYKHELDEQEQQGNQRSTPLDVGGGPEPGPSEGREEV